MPEAGSRTGTPAVHSRPAASYAVCLPVSRSPGAGSVRSGARAPAGRLSRARPASCRPGPHSSSSQSSAAPVAASAATVAPNRTGRQSWSAQYAGSVICSSVNGAAVAAENTGRSGARRGTAATSAANSSRTAVSSGTCIAYGDRSGVQPMPRSRRRTSAAATGSGAPPTTQVCGPLLIATATPSGSSGAISSAPRCTASIRPSGAACTRRPRAAASRSASGRSNTPATVAATSSPALWPIIAAGFTPQGSPQSLAIAYSRTNSAGML